MFAAQVDPGDLGKWLLCLATIVGALYYIVKLWMLVRGDTVTHKELEAVERRIDDLHEEHIAAAEGRAEKINRKLDDLIYRLSNKK